MIKIFGDCAQACGLMKQNLSQTNSVRYAKTSSKARNFPIAVYIILDIFAHLAAKISTIYYMETPLQIISRKMSFKSLARYNLYRSLAEFMASHTQIIHTMSIKSFVKQRQNVKFHQTQNFHTSKKLSQIHIGRFMTISQSHIIPCMKPLSRNLFSIWTNRQLVKISLSFKTLS